MTSRADDGSQAVAGRPQATAGTSSQQRYSQQRYSQQRHSDPSPRCASPFLPTSALVLVTLLALLLTACATSPATAAAPRLEAGRRTTVRLVQFQSGQVLTLQNASSGTTNEVYSDERSDPLTKVVRDDTLQSLLDHLASQGMFDRGGSVPAEAREALVVEHGGQRWAWARILPYSMAEKSPAELAFHATAQEFRATWDSATAFHTERERPNFKQEKERVRGELDSSQRKLETLQGLRQPPAPVQVPR